MMPAMFPLFAGIRLLIALRIDAVDIPLLLIFEVVYCIALLPWAHVPVVSHLLNPEIIVSTNLANYFITLIHVITIAIVIKVIIVAVCVSIRPWLVWMIVVAIPISIIILCKGSRNKQGRKYQCKNLFHD